MSQTMRTHPLVSFGPFELDTLARELKRNGEQVPLTQKTFDVLVCLIENRGRVVTKNELIGAVWPAVVVEENNLSQRICALRRALGDTSRGSRYILTVPRRGYQFIAEVREWDEARAAEPSGEGITAAPVGEHGREPGAAARAGKTGFRTLPWMAVVLVAASLSLASFYAGRATLARADGLPRRVVPRSIAVVPFLSLNSHGQANQLGLGLAEALDSRLSATPGWRVSPLAAVLGEVRRNRSPQQIARDLDVQDILAGETQQVGRRTRVTVQLWNTARGRAVWSSEFDTAVTDIFGVEDSISREVARAVPLPRREDLRPKTPADRRLAEKAGQE